MYLGRDEGVASAVIVTVGACCELSEVIDFDLLANELAAPGMLRMSSTKPRFLIRFAP